MYLKIKVDFLDNFSIFITNLDEKLIFYKTKSILFKLILKIKDPNTLN